MRGVIRAGKLDRGHLVAAALQLARLRSGAGADFENARTGGEQRDDPVDLRTPDDFKVLEGQHGVRTLLDEDRLPAV
jgi:hypothetical protein